MTIKELMQIVPKEDMAQIDQHGNFEDKDVRDYTVDDLLYGRFVITKDGDLLVGVQDRGIVRLPLEDLAIHMAKEFRTNLAVAGEPELSIRPKKIFKIAQFFLNVKERNIQRRLDRAAQSQKGLMQ